MVNVAKLVKVRLDVQLRQSLAETTFTVADGVPIVWLSVLCGCRLPERVAGIDIMNELLARETSTKRYGVAAREILMNP